MIRHLQDPEHPDLTLEQLSVVDPSFIKISPDARFVEVGYKPTVPNCSVATLIGLTLRTKLQQSCPLHSKVKVVINPGTHQDEIAVNKQLADKERVHAALENPNLRKVIDQGIMESLRMPEPLSVFGPTN
jgi:metal-sulfur cluster biosynthetic enzyme